MRKRSFESKLKKELEMENPSPESKLLHLLRKKQDSLSAEKEKESMSPGISSILSRFRIEKDKYPFYIKTIHKLNILLGFLLSLSILYLLLDSFILAPYSVKKLLKEKEKSVGFSVWKNQKEKDQKQESRPYTYYTNRIGDRDIFNPPIPSPSISSENKQVLAELKLLGIATGKKNPHAIIEDKSAEKVYFLSEGDYIKQMQLESIEEGRVILNHQGEKLELKF
ncbi:MAG: hypothetical protein DRP75_02015 [Candidatus Omnitrophota bacterium]|nr:MAG: hypothetical protein DRP75_02015 [Candidatus Omnitrophota bacterium]